MYIAIDQYNQHHLIRHHPRKELLTQLGASRADKMYVDAADGQARHIGYVIRGLWLHVFRLDAAFPPKRTADVATRHAD
jgi:hypothetical protein